MARKKKDKIDQILDIWSAMTAPERVECQRCIGRLNWDGAPEPREPKPPAVRKQKEQPQAVA